jgi:hypothetical protein
MSDHQDEDEFGDKDPDDAVDDEDEGAEPEDDGR